MPVLKLGPEPVAIIGLIVAGLTVAQSLALRIPSGVHAGIGVAIIALGTVTTRAGVSPVPTGE